MLRVGAWVTGAQMYTSTLSRPMTAAEAALRLERDGHLCWLDGDGQGEQGRFSFVSSAPQAVHQVPFGRAPFENLDDRLTRPPSSAQRTDAAAAPLTPDQVPHWAGLVAYDAHWSQRPVRLPRDPGLPVVWFGRYPSWFVCDHGTGACHLVGDDRAACDALRARLERPPRPQRAAVDAPRAPDAARHLASIERVLWHIRRGDTYQVNLAHAWHARLSGDPLFLALRMRAQSPVPFGAYLDLGAAQVVCRSMERFLRLCAGDRRLLTRPIKGTIARAGDRDALEAACLRGNPKERAEHAMIVDLMRNDLGRVAEVGSVRVEDVMAVEPYAGLSHLVSSVACRVRPGVGLGEILAATFPPGSVTGTPKLKAIEIIEALETGARGPYCGAIGFVDRAGGISLAVAIRTALVRAGQVSYHAGGGLVEASRAAAELDETVLKARVFLDAIHTASPESG